MCSSPPPLFYLLLDANHPNVSDSYFKFSMCVPSCKSVQFTDGEKKKHMDVIDGSATFLCSVLLGPILLEVVRNRRLICVKRPLLLWEKLTDPLGISLWFWFLISIVSFIQVWLTVTQVNTGALWESQVRVFFFSRLMLLFLQGSLEKQIRALLIQQMNVTKLHFWENCIIWLKGK